MKLINTSKTASKTPFKNSALKTTLALCIATTLASPMAFADRKQNLQDAKSGATFLGSAIVGGIAGGPVGFILGAIGGAYFAEQGQQKLEQGIQLEQVAMNASQLEMHIDKQSLEISKLEEMISEKMRFQMYFTTGQHTLKQNDETQLQALADFLKENDYMHITIDGHADPRGDTDYNIDLSYRMHLKGHGASFSNAALGSIEEYAQERRVNIQVFPSKDSADLAVVN